MGDSGSYQYLNARDDWAKTDEDSPIGIDVLANDSGASGIVKVDGKPITADTAPIVLASGATVDLDGTRLLYDPGAAFQALNAGQSASDKFSYTAGGSGKSTDTAYVKVTVAGNDEEQPDANGPPVAADDEAEVPIVAIDLDLDLLPSPRSVTIDVLANDKDPEGGPLKVATIAGTEVDTDPATDLPDTVTLDKGTATVTLNADGSLTYAEILLDFDWDISFDSLIEGYELNENGELVPVDGGEPVLLDPISPSLPSYFDPSPINSFTYTATDDNGAESNAATVTIYEYFQGLDVEPVAVEDPTDPWLMQPGDGLAGARIITDGIRVEGQELFTTGEWGDTMGYDGWYSYLNAKDDWAKTDEDSSVAIDVLANDVGASGIVKINGKPVTADTAPIVLASGATV